VRRCLRYLHAVLQQLIMLPLTLFQLRLMSIGWLASSDSGIG
jgi:hypothetical protein